MEHLRCFSMCSNVLHGVEFVYRCFQFSIILYIRRSASYILFMNTRDRNVYRNHEFLARETQRSGDDRPAEKKGRRPDFTVSTQMEFELVTDGQVLTKPTWLNAIGAGWVTPNGNISIKIGHLSFLLKPTKNQ